MTQNTLNKTAGPFLMVYNTSDKIARRSLGTHDETVTMTSNLKH